MSCDVTTFIKTHSDYICVLAGEFPCIQSQVLGSGQSLISQCNINLELIIIIIIINVDLFAETESFLTAIQDQVILTRNYKKYILKQAHTDELCRRCGKESETIQHITAACEQLAPTEYVKRHDGLAKIIHQKLAEAAELIEDKSPYYKHKPANVLENENFKLY